MKIINKKEEAYTLLEMVLSVAIFSMVVLTVSTSFWAITNTWKIVTKHNKKIENLLIVDRLFDSSVRNAIPFAWKNDNLKKRQIFLGEQNRILFAYQHRIANIRQGGIRFIDLSLNNGSLLAKYSNTPILPWLSNTGENIKKEVLLEEIRNLSFLYADVEDEKLKWVDSWSEENDYIPLAVLMTIEWKNGGTECWLRRTAGAGLYESLGIRRKNKIEQE